MSAPLDRAKLTYEPGFRVRGLIWQRDGEYWERAMLRRYSDGTAHWEQVHHVPADAKEICMRCLSVHVLREKIPEGQLTRWYRCTDCQFDFLVDSSLEP